MTTLHELVATKYLEIVRLLFWDSQFFIDETAKLIELRRNFLPETGIVVPLIVVLSLRLVVPKGLDSNVASSAISVAI